MCYQKKVVRKSFYQKAIDFREQRANAVSLSEDIETRYAILRVKSCWMTIIRKVWHRELQKEFLMK